MTPREQADLKARVGRRIGLEGSVARWFGEDDWRCRHETNDDSGPCYQTFDPPKNPADERLIWEWLERKPLHVSWYYDGYEHWFLLENMQRIPDPDRVTALMLAVDNLPEDV